MLVRRLVVFLQYGTSARLAAPLICMPAPEYAGRSHAWRKEVFAASASARSESGRDGAETLRAPAASNGRGPQGKATVDSIVAGVTFTGVFKCEARQQK